MCGGLLRYKIVIKCCIFIRFISETINSKTRSRMLLSVVQHLAPAKKESNLLKSMMLRNICYIHYA